MDIDEQNSNGVSEESKDNENDSEDIKALKVCNRSDHPFHLHFFLQACRRY